MFNSMDELGSSEPIYTKVQRFYVRNSANEEKQRDLRITVDMNTTLSKVSKQLLYIQVNDDDDPFFFYSLVLANEDYQRLKTLQGLLVDFDNFPSQVIRLLEQCKQDETHESKFLLLLEEETKSDMRKTLLKIVETNNFKHLCHLILQIEVGNDNDIKQLMHKKIKLLKDHNIKAEKLISNLESQLNMKGKKLDAIQNELAVVQQQWKEDRITFKAESSREITEETQKLRKVQLEWQIKAEREKSELEERYGSQLKERDTEISRLRVENQILLEKRTNSDVTITDQARRIDSLEKELTTVKGDIILLRKHNTRLDSENHDKEKTVNHFKTKLAVAEQESKDKTILTNKLQELLNNANEQKSKLEELVNERDKHLQRKQITIQNISDELIKANEIITKLQKELGLLSSKLSIRTSIALEQEKVVEENVRTIAKLEQEVLLQDKKITCLSDAEQVLKSTLAELKESLETKEKKIKDNERVIDWLNRRLSDQSKSMISPTTQTSVPVSSTPYSQHYRSPIELTTSRVPFTSVNTAVTTLQQLEQYKKPTVIEEHTEQENNQSNGNESHQPQAININNPKTKPVISPQENSSTKSNQTKKTPTSKKSPAIGFRRAQTASIPSSYFLK